MSELELVQDNWLYWVYVGFGMLLIGAAMLFAGPIRAGSQAKKEDHDRYLSPTRPASFRLFCHTGSGTTNSGSGIGSI